MAQYSMPIKINIDSNANSPLRPLALSFLKNMQQTCSNDHFCTLNLESVHFN